jgi:uncharacterized membrane protein YgdD (TMEM256/DUF423 family)
MKNYAALSSLSIAVAVICGAFGAHALRDAVPAEDLLIWEKAVLYHFIHGFGALLVATSLSSWISTRAASRICTLLFLSTCVFSGSLYLLVLFNQRWLGMITPLGGTGFIVAWLTLAVLLWRGPKGV